MLENDEALNSLSLACSNLVVFLDDVSDVLDHDGVLRGLGEGRGRAANLLHHIQCLVIQSVQEAAVLRVRLYLQGHED